MLRKDDVCRLLDAPKLINTPVFSPTEYLREFSAMMFHGFLHSIKVHPEPRLMRLGSGNGGVTIFESRSGLSFFGFDLGTATQPDKEKTAVFVARATEPSGARGGLIEDALQAGAYYISVRTSTPLNDEFERLPYSACRLVHRFTQESSVNGLAGWHLPFRMTRVIRKKDGTGNRHAEQSGNYAFNLSSALAAKG